MTYIIHPGYVYLFGLLSNLSSVLGIFLVLCSIILVIGLVHYSEIKESLRKHFKTLFIVIVCCLVLGAIIPSEKTMLQMAVARYATEENISKFIKNGKIVKDEFKKDIFEIITVFQDKK